MVGAQQEADTLFNKGTLYKGHTRTISREKRLWLVAERSRPPVLSGSDGRTPCPPTALCPLVHSPCEPRWRWSLESTPGAEQDGDVQGGPGGAEGHHPAPRAGSGSPRLD